jgi:hypothetical protein
MIYFIILRYPLNNLSFAVKAVDTVLWNEVSSSRKAKAYPKSLQLHLVMGVL